MPGSLESFVACEDLALMLASTLSVDETVWELARVHLHQEHPLPSQIP
jgi:hypothetical protein